MHGNIKIFWYTEIRDTCTWDFILSRLVYKSGMRSYEGDVTKKQTGYPHVFPTRIKMEWLKQHLSASPREKQISTGYHCSVSCCLTIIFNLSFPTENRLEHIMSSYPRETVIRAFVCDAQGGNHALRLWRTLPHQPHLSLVQVEVLRSSGSDTVSFR